MLAEIDKLEATRSCRLPANLFRDVAPKVVKEWRDLALVESPSRMRVHPVQLQQAKLVPLLFCRQQEIVDALVMSVVSTVHRISARANRRVTTDLVTRSRTWPGCTGRLPRFVGPEHTFWTSGSKRLPAKRGGTVPAATPP